MPTASPRSPGARRPESREQERGKVRVGGRRCQRVCWRLREGRGRGVARSKPKSRRVRRELSWGYPLQGGVPQTLLWVGWGLHSQCLTFFLSGCNGERTESEVGSPPQLLSVRLSVCLWWISVSREVWWDPKSFPSPSRPPAIFRGPVWFGWGPTKMWDLLIKDSKQLVVGGFW